MDLGFALQVTLMGFTGVVLVLVVLMVVLNVPHYVSKMGEGRKERRPQPQQQAVVSEIPHEHLAAISAAVAMLDGAYRVRTIEVVSNDNWERCRYTDITTP